jgi:signal transduction histidine kinase
VEARVEGGELHLSVDDDGSGFDEKAVRMGLGLRGMRERATLIGGKLEVESSSDSGTRIRACLPLPANQVRGAGAEARVTR